VPRKAKHLWEFKSHFLFLAESFKDCYLIQFSVLLNRKNVTKNLKNLLYTILETP